MSCSVLAVVVAWNSRDDTLALVASLQLQEPRPDILVIDNASDDGLAGELQHRGFDVLRVGSNLGGAGGFALGMRRAMAAGYDFAWLLDGDALTRPGALAGLLSAIGEDATVGAVGSCIVMRDPPHMVQEIGARFSGPTARPHFLHAFERPDPDLSGEDVDYLPACSLLVRRQALAEVGPFDPALFVFCDDIDWCLRLRRAGWRLCTAPASQVEHRFHGGKPVAPWRAYYGCRNQLLVQHRHRGILPAIWSLLYIRRRELLWRRRGGRDVAKACRYALLDALRGRLGPRCIRGESIVAAKPVTSCLLASGDLAWDLGRIAACKEGGMQHLLIGVDHADGPLERLLADDRSQRFVARRSRRRVELTTLWSLLTCLLAALPLLLWRRPE